MTVVVSVLVIVAVLVGLYLWHRHITPRINRGFKRVLNPDSMERGDRLLAPMTITSGESAADITKALITSIPVQPPVSVGQAVLYLADRTMKPDGSTILTYAWGTLVFGDSFRSEVEIEPTHTGCEITQEVTHWMDRVGTPELEQFRESLISAIQGADPAAVVSYDHDEEQ